MTDTTTRVSSRTAQRALQRRRRRQVKMAPARVARAGRPVRSAMLRVPFVVALIAVLGGGVGSVLYLNTKADEAGVRTEQAKQASAQLRLEIEALGRGIAEQNATPRIAEQARQLGLVPAGDAAILVIGADGTWHVVGTPKPVAGASAGHSASTAGTGTVSSGGTG